MKHSIKNFFIFCIFFNACAEKQPPPIIPNAIFARSMDYDSLFQFKKESYHFQGMPIYSCYFKYNLRLGHFGGHYLIADSIYLYELLIDKYYEKYYEQSKYSIYLWKSNTTEPIVFQPQNKDSDIIFIEPALCFFCSPGDTFKIHNTRIILKARVWDARLADSIYHFRRQENSEEGATGEAIITVGRATGIKGLARWQFDTSLQKFYITEWLGKPFEPYFSIPRNHVLQIDTTQPMKDNYHVDLSKIKAFHKIW